MESSDVSKTPYTDLIGKVRGELRQWDPIGVYKMDMGCPEGEYDAYIGPVVSHLRDGHSESEMAAWLKDLASERMGITSTTERHIATARALVRLWNEFNSRSD